MGSIGTTLVMELQGRRVGEERNDAVKYFSKFSNNFTEKPRISRDPKDLDNDEIFLCLLY